MKRTNVERKYIFLFSGMLFAASLMPASVLAQSKELGPVLDRLERLERDIRTLNVQISRGTEGGAPLPLSSGEDDGAAMARLGVRLDELESELRSTTGKIEDMTFQVDQINSRLEKLVGDIDYRLSAIENRLSGQGGNQGMPTATAAPSPPGVQKVLPGAQPTGVLGTLKESDLQGLVTTETTEGQQPQAVAPAQPAPVSAESVEPPAAEEVKVSSLLPEGTPKQQYQFAFGLLRKTEYAAAEGALQEFINRHGDDPLAPNARYWLAETYYVRAEFVKAAETFLAGYKLNNEGPKAPDSLLKLGMSLVNLDKRSQACATYSKLLADYPDAKASLLSRAKAEHEKNGC